MTRAHRARLAHFEPHLAATKREALVVVAEGAMGGGGADNCILPFLSLPSFHSSVSPQIQIQSEYSSIILIPVAFLARRANTRGPRRDGRLPPAR